MGGVYWCRDCYCKKYMEQHGGECSESRFRHLSAHASGRRVVSLKQIADSAFVKLTRDCFGGSSRDHLAKMRACFAKGLDKKATETFGNHLTKLALDNPYA